MAKKKIIKLIKLQIPAGKANPAPPIGPALGSAGVNIMGFCKEFNAKTQAQGNAILPTIITVYQDKSFSFETMQPPVAELIKEELKIPKGSAVPNRNKVGKLNASQLNKIAQRKAKDFNVNTLADDQQLQGQALAAAINLVKGTARSMGIDIVEE